MSVTLAQIDRRVDSAQELESVTHTMKGMAAVSVRHFERAADAMGIYESTLDRGLQVVARHLDADDVAWERHSRFPPRRSAVIVFGSNQGLCGPVNRQVGPADDAGQRVLAGRDTHHQEKQRRRNQPAGSRTARTYRSLAARRSQPSCSLGLSQLPRASCRFRTR